MAKIKYIKYKGKRYSTTLKEDTHTGSIWNSSGGIWELSGRVAASICDITDPTNYNHSEDIQKIIYDLVRHDILDALESEMG